MPVNALAPPSQNAFNAMGLAPQIPNNPILATTPVDPYDFTTKHNTELTPHEEKQFLTWSKKNNKINDLYDYDLRGAWKENMQASDNGHLGDKYKKPNHPTFSDQSIYHSEDMPGGVWGQDVNGRDTFTPSLYNLQNMNAPSLQDYFQRYEPNVILNLPTTQ